MTRIRTLDVENFREGKRKQVTKVKNYFLKIKQDEQHLRDGRKTIPDDKIVI